MLLGLIGEGQEIASRVLKSMGITMKEARKIAKELAGSYEPNKNLVVTKTPFSPTVKTMFDGSLKKSRKLGNTYIGTEHLMLVLLKLEKVDAEGSIAFTILKRLGVETRRIEAEIYRFLNDQRPPFDKEPRKKTPALDKF